MSAWDWIIGAMDTLEYAGRRVVCRVVGHRWEEQWEQAGEASYPTMTWCGRCGRVG